MNSSLKRSKVFLLSSTLTTGGAEQVVKALAIGLPEHGYTTHIICLHGLGAIGTEISKYGVATHFGLSRRRYDPSVFFKLVRLFRKERRAILFSLDHHDATFWGALASSCAGIRHRVLSMHSTGLWGKGGSFTLSDRLALRLYDRVVALARIHAEYLKRDEGIGAEKIAVINNGVDTERFNPIGSVERRTELRRRLEISADCFVVTIVAVLRPEKNHEMLLRSAGKILSRDKNFLFLIVGDGEGAGNLQTIVRELSLGTAVRFMGLRSDIPEILSVSDVSVLCSYPVVETFPIAVLESMASGVPVVATSVGSIPEMIEDGVDGILIPSGDERALTEALVTLEENPERRAAIGMRAREKVAERYSEKRMVEEYANLFKDLLKER